MGPGARTSPRTAATPRVAVRRALPGDFESVLALRLALRREERPEAPPNDLDLGTTTRKQLQGTTQAIFLAECDGEALGVLRCALQGPGDLGPLCALLTTAYVVPDWRRCGVMTRLVAAAEAWCRQRDVRELRLRNAHGNTTANAAWESLGFSTVQVVRHRLLGP